MSEPEPEPLHPEVTTIHGSSETAVQEQPEDGVTWIVARPPAAANDCEKGGVSPVKPHMTIWNAPSLMSEVVPAASLTRTWQTGDMDCGTTHW